MKAKDLNNSSFKTKALIKNAFAELLMEKRDLNNITVKELTERADINRGTFYIHYDSIYGVAEDFEEEILKNLKINNIRFRNISDIDEYFDSIINYLKENEELYRMLLVSDGPRLYLDKLSKNINKSIYEGLEINGINKDSKEIRFSISFFVDGIINQVLKYLISNVDYNLDDINYYMKKYFRLLYEKN